MRSVEIYLPLTSNEGTPCPGDLFERIERELTERFGGVTAHKRAPAQGRWKNGGTMQADEIAIFEVLVEAFDKGWWQAFRRGLEERLGQEKILITARDIEIL